MGPFIRLFIVINCLHLFVQQSRSIEKYETILPDSIKHVLEIIEKKKNVSLKQAEWKRLNIGDEIRCYSIIVIGDKSEIIIRSKKADINLNLFAKSRYFLFPSLEKTDGKYVYLKFSVKFNESIVFHLTYKPDSKSKYYLPLFTNDDFISDVQSIEGEGVFLFSYGKDNAWKYTDVPSMKNVTVKPK